MATDLQWKGYAVEDTKEWESFKLIDFKPKPQGDYDVDIKIEFCGVCGSDVHTVTGGWGQPRLPVIPGHEIAGVAVRVGPKVTTVKVGDRVGVGAQVRACHECKLCDADNEQYCPKHIFTYNSVYPECGTVSTGGYSSAIRAHEHFVFPIPDGLKLEDAAPMLCGGLTVFSPLVRNGAGPGKRVGIVGIGGLGHFGLQFAKALGCEEVVAFSHSSRKKEDALKLGATTFVATAEPGFEKPLHASLDLIVVMYRERRRGIPLKELLSTIVPGGKFVMVALPENVVPSVAKDLIGLGVFFGGSLLGSKKEVLQMLQVASEKGVKPWIEVMPMKDAGKAVRAVKDGRVRYRHVLKQDIVQ
ncbi:NADPH-dependent alcohol dehydrogenase [Flammula alnicola]|nr:NADPH-dependent alcohol dehydrogenase [Flammula alnicola]